MKNAFHSLINHALEKRIIEPCDRHYAENLIMAKGFKDVVVTMTDGYVDVIIVSKEMDDTTRAQIEDIVKRKLEVSADKITINVIDT